MYFKDKSIDKVVDGDKVIFEDGELVEELEASTNESAETPEETTAITAAESNIELISLTTPIGRNDTAIISIVGLPNTEYDIDVFYSTSESEAKGLENQISDDSGAVSWSWKIGGKVATGKYNIHINGGGETYKTELEVE